MDKAFRTVRDYYSQSKKVDLKHAKKLIYDLYNSDYLKYQYEPQLMYHILRTMIKDKHTDNARFIAISLLTTDHLKLVNHFMKKGYKWHVIDRDLAWLAFNLV